MDSFNEGRTPIQAWEEILTDVMENVMPGIIAKMEGPRPSDVVGFAVEVADGVHKAWGERSVMAGWQAPAKPHA